MALLLLIEDEETLRNNTQELLELHGYQCIVAANGNEGVDLAKEFLPDLVICDVLLPGIDGFGLKTVLNDFEPTSNIPFIYLSSKAEREDMRKAMDLGAKDYITKPFKFVEVASSIERILLQKADLHKSIDDHVIKVLVDYIKLAKHECNTPLHAITTLTELLRVKNQSGETIDELAVAIITSSKRLSKTLTNLGELMRLTHYFPMEEYVYKAFNVSDVILITARTNLKINNRLSDLTAEIEQVSSAEFAKEDIATMIDELTDNAVKFSQPLSRITVDFGKADASDQFVLKVHNQLSVATTFTENDIRPFKQHDCTLVRQHGSGLGLYLVSLIVKKYNGKLRVEYTADMGITIVVSLPVGRSNPAHQDNINMVGI
ncbi:hybrid sensor histidine kinase/response regulator [Pedobacter hartonius]|uniref:histidine kinase n=1 Tax=Pedobacter hartonius TaxID=425514 RepID=A0A1H4D1I1_9SPHI|nr:response regulator [Pedobacter hartonius]SEA66584.1 Histidine kinase-, DNA gyrase B-, and HSP90-like ATPase [Pedobacter hartonius]